MKNEIIFTKSNVQQVLEHAFAHIYGYILLDEQ